ncbi:MAG: DUF4846 domain-containing protein [Crocinitomicaceae bacterium]
MEDSVVVTRDTTEQSAVEFNPQGMTLASRYNTPAGFERIKHDSLSFAHYLRNLPLKSADELVEYYNGNTKSQGNVYRSVVDLPIGNKNLHQCADAVMRFRAEYLWSTGQHNDIHFNFTNGFQVDYSKWLAGNRMVVSGNKTYWTSGSPRQNNYKTFWKYMELIFNYAGTLSLDRELPSRDFKEMEIGDILIQGGSPGHAVIVVDLCENTETGEKRYLLAQSYMPAQETQILINPSNPETSWYSMNDDEIIYTPEWTFYPEDLKHF